MQKFTHLHVHSHYSLLDGLPKVDELLNYVKELGMDSIALTDHGVLYGAVEFYKKAKEKGIKPIIGSELYLAFEGMRQERPGIDDKRYHLVLLVKNEEGYKNLVKLITKAHLEGFYYKPRIDEELLAQYSKGLIGLTACLQGKIPRLIMSKKIKEAEELALKYQGIFGKDNFYLEIQHHPKIPEQQKVNDVLIALSKKLGIPLVATQDAHYLRPSDTDAQDILMLINTGADINDPERLSMKEEDFSLKSTQEMIDAFRDVPEAIENTRKIQEMCNFEFELGKIKLPHFELPEEKNTDDFLKELCYQKLEKRYPNASKEIIDRLEYELSVIRQTGFASYFLIVQDFVNWAKEKRIVVGPGRGSVAGSIVSYILNITNVDPIKYNLLFERFLNPERALPDIDLDFTDRRRNEVIEYVAQKYGRDKVAQIITFGTMAAKAVIRDVGRALGYNYSYCDRLAKMIPLGFTLEQTLSGIDEFRQMYESDSQAKTLIDLAKKLEGVARHASTHACGVVISKEPLENIVPLQHPTQNDQNIVTQYEMHAIEDLGILKMDFLGLKNLTIIEDTLARIYKIHNQSINIDTIPLDDKKVYELLQKGDTTCVFQLESNGMQRYLKQLKPTELEDIISMVALYRPGPMDSIPDFISAKQGKKKITYLHPSLKPILEKTCGVIVTQDQVLEIARSFAGFTYAQADILRKAVGKKIKKLLDEQKEKFIKGAKNTQKTDDKLAEKVWNFIEPFARYGFNRAHAAAYATIAYQTAWLKASYPVEFMSAVLTSEKADVERIAVLIEECKKMGIVVLAPDINESFMFFSVVPDKHQIRFGLLGIKNVGQNVVEAILQERKNQGPYSSIYDFVSRVSSKDLNKKSMESLIKAGVFDRLAERNQLLQNMEKLLEQARQTKKDKINGQKGLFDSLPQDPQRIKLASAAPILESEKLRWEKELLGLYISGHPLKNYRKILKEKCLPIMNVSQELAGRLVKVGGIISSIKKIITKKGQPMLFVNLEDEAQRIELVVFPSTLENYPNLFQENKIVFVSGRVDLRDNTPKIICNSIEEIVEE